MDVHEPETRPHIQQQHQLSSAAQGTATAPNAARLSVEPLRRLAWACWRCDTQVDPNARPPAAGAHGYGASASASATAGGGGTSATAQRGGSSPLPSSSPPAPPPASPAGPSVAGLAKKATDVGQWRVELDVPGMSRRAEQQVPRWRAWLAGLRPGRCRWTCRRAAGSQRPAPACQQAKREQQQQQQAEGAESGSDVGGEAEAALPPAAAAVADGSPSGRWSRSDSDGSNFGTSGAGAAAAADAAGPACAGLCATRPVAKPTPAPPPPAGNLVTTSKYTLVTFMPVFLFEVFSRVAYLYFLLQAALSWWRVVSPFSGIGSTAALVFVVLVSGVKAAVEDVRRHLEDRATNRARTRRLQPDGTVLEVLWKDVRVGDVVEVRDNELLPADLLLLRAGLPEGIAFVRTTNLDGETNLKVRRAVRLPGWDEQEEGPDTAAGEGGNAAGTTASSSRSNGSGNSNRSEGSEGGESGDEGSSGGGGGSSASESEPGGSTWSSSLAMRRQLLTRLRGEVVCEPPNRSLHSFAGGLTLDPPLLPPVASPAVPPPRTHGSAVTQIRGAQWASAGFSGGGPTAAAGLAAPPSPSPPPPPPVPLSMDNMLLRGCVLKNSEYVLGMAVYCGPQTRIQMNAVRPALKVGSFDRFLNTQILVLLLLQLLLSVASAVVSWVWRERAGVRRPHLALDDPVQGNWRSPVTYIVLMSITFWILYGYLVPISLFVTMELVKFWQAFVFINYDPALVETPQRHLPPPEHWHHHRHQCHHRPRRPSAGSTDARTHNDLQSGNGGQGLPAQHIHQHHHHTGGNGGGDGDGVAAAAATASSDVNGRGDGAGGGGGGGEHAFARSSAVNEDLGRVVMVFSDKTGTLTRNDMRLRCCALGPARFGRLDVRLEERPELAGMAAVEAFDPRLPPALAELSRAGAWRAAVEGGGAGGFIVAGCSDNGGGGGGGGGREQQAPKQLLQPQLQQLLARRWISFWLGVCVCNSVVLEPHPAADRPPAYQGPSPDEVALVEAARHLGFELAARWKDTIELKIETPPNEPAAPAAEPLLPSSPSPQPAAGASGAAAAAAAAAAEPVVIRYRVLNVLEFTSARRRMSVVVQAPDGSLALHTKGADSVILPRLEAAGGGHPAKTEKGCAGDLQQAAVDSLHRFATQGLRTLVLAARLLPDRAWYEAWDARYQAAAAAVHADPRVRAMALDDLAEEMERGLQLVGVAAIEDQLQEGVPEAVATLLAAGVRVWMITGDKLETAVNVARAARLVTQPEDGQLLVLREHEEEAIRQQLGSLARRAAAINAAGAKGPSHHGNLKRGYDGGGGASAHEPRSWRNPSTPAPPPSLPPPPAQLLQQRRRGHMELELSRTAPAGPVNWGEEGACSGGGGGTGNSGGGSATDGVRPSPAAAAAETAGAGSKGAPGSDPDPEAILMANLKSGGEVGLEAGWRWAGRQRRGGGGGGGAPSMTTELVVDGRTLDMVLERRPLAARLAALCASCASVVVCRASPAQKAALVRLMRAYRRRVAAARQRRRWHWLTSGGGCRAAGAAAAAVASVRQTVARVLGCGRGGFERAEARSGAGGEARSAKKYVGGTGAHSVADGEEDEDRDDGGSLGGGGAGGDDPRDCEGVLLAIGDGANDVAMIQAADVGVGVMGKEGRQAVNNSDVALPLFRHLVPLLLVHGQLCSERLSRLITYSFYKNLTYWGVLLLFQFYCGFSGQALIDDISGSFYNVVFTALPILVVALQESHAPDPASTLVRHPELYNAHPPLSPQRFWLEGVLLPLLHSVACFFIPMYGATPYGTRPAHTLWVVGKAVYMAVVVAVTSELLLTTRAWSRLLGLACGLSVAVAFPFLLLVWRLELSAGYQDEATVGAADLLFASPYFWTSLVAVVALTAGTRYYERAVRWIYFPDSFMVLAREHQRRQGMRRMGYDVAMYPSSTGGGSKVAASGGGSGSGSGSNRQGVP